MPNNVRVVATMVASTGEKLRPAAVLPVSRIIITGGERFGFLPISDARKVPVSRVLRMNRLIQRAA
ncbi:hypothetical protein [Sphingomonas sp. CARO-RG-8B-R24-01]|uniref:hypothetical protein n=1 Tax=Sphingomonas sp. CARO-RG-8B-R24-01 TaxID=2914831 RepID=UPI001F5890CF|nr:hypothetical protein [Sphingomonas sp. CARO-RG-8B-R24-01]